MSCHSSFASSIPTLSSCAPLRHARRALAALAACAVVVGPLSGCEDPFSLLFNFDRELPTPRGGIFGSIVRDVEDGDAASYAQVTLIGTGLVRQASSEGALALVDLGAGTYLLRILDDEDGDGQPERSRLLATTLTVANKPDALGFGTSTQLVSTSIGPVVVEGTGALSGSITVDDGTGTFVPPATLGYGARALLYRTLQIDAVGDQALQLGADAETHVDDTGAFQFNQVGAGDAFVVVTIHELDPIDGHRGRTVFMSAPEATTVDAGQTTTLAPVLAPGIDLALEDQTRPVEVVVTPPIDERAAPYAIFAPPGRPLSACESARPSVTQFAYERLVNATTSAIARLEQAPVGVWDIRLCGEARFVDPETGTLDDSTTLGTATLFSFVVLPANSSVETLLTGPVVLQAQGDPCLRTICEDGTFNCDSPVVIRDCDGDALAGIPPYDAADPVNVATWQECADVCGTLLGAAAAQTTCSVRGLIFDCDDDGDLQADTSEDPACVGPGLGDDRDGDGLCSGEDAFPTCAANTAAQCGAGRNDVFPAVPSIFVADGVEPDPAPTPEPTPTPEPAPPPVTDPTFNGGSQTFGVVDLNIDVLSVNIRAGGSVDAIYVVPDALPVPRFDVHSADAEGIRLTSTPVEGSAHSAVHFNFRRVVPSTALEGEAFWVGSAFDVNGLAAGVVCKSRYSGNGPYAFDVAFGDQGCIFEVSGDLDNVDRWDAAAFDGTNVYLAGPLMDTDGQGDRLIVRKIDVVTGGFVSSAALPLSDLEVTPGEAVENISIAGVVGRTLNVNGLPRERVVVLGDFNLPDQFSESYFGALELLPTPGGVLRRANVGIEGRVADNTVAVGDQGETFVQGIGTVDLLAPEGRCPMVWQIELDSADFLNQGTQTRIYPEFAQVGLTVHDGAIVPIAGNATMILAVGTLVTVDGENAATAWRLPSAGGAASVVDLNPIDNIDSSATTQAKAIARPFNTALDPANFYLGGIHTNGATGWMAKLLPSFFE